MYFSDTVLETPVLRGMEQGGVAHNALQNRGTTILTWFVPLALTFCLSLNCCQFFFEQSRGSRRRHSVRAPVLWVCTKVHTDHLLLLCFMLSCASLNCYLSDLRVETQRPCMCLSEAVRPLRMPSWIFCGIPWLQCLPQAWLEPGRPGGPHSRHLRRTGRFRLPSLNGERWWNRFRGFCYQACMLCLSM